MHRIEEFKVGQKVIIQNEYNEIIRRPTEAVVTRVNSQEVVVDYWSHAFEKHITTWYCWEDGDGYVRSDCDDGELVRIVGGGDLITSHK